MTIYFIRAGDSGNIKIGYTSGCPKKRMAQLQTGNIFDLELLGTIPGEMCDEKSIHRELGEYALRGEWFRAERELVSIIAEMIERQHPWYFIRQPKILRSRIHRMESEWLDAFHPMTEMDQSAFDVSSGDGDRYCYLWGARKKPWYFKRIEEENSRLRQAQTNALKAEAQAGIILSEDIMEEIFDISPPSGNESEKWWLKKINHITNLRRTFQSRESDARFIIETRKANETKSSVAA